MTLLISGYMYKYKFHSNVIHYITATYEKWGQNTFVFKVIITGVLLKNMIEITR